MPNDSCKNNCSLFDFMANTMGVKVLHPGGYEATKEICSHIKLDKNSKVLDLACGVGSSSFYLSKKYNCHITGIDISETLIGQAKEDLKIHKKSQIIFEVGDALNLPYEDNSFDAVISQAFFILIDNKEKALEEIYRVLKPGGYLGSLELGWLKAPSKEIYNELVEKTCSSMVPRMLEFAEWEKFFSKKLTLIKTTKNSMTSGILKMIKIEGVLNFIRIVLKMISQPGTRKKMMEVQNSFKKYDDYFGYGLFVLKK